MVASSILFDLSHSSITQRKYKHGFIQVCRLFQSGSQSSVYVGVGNWSRGASSLNIAMFQMIDLANIWTQI